MMKRVVCLSILTMGTAAAFTTLPSEPAAANCVDFSRNPGRFTNNCGRRVVVTWSDEFACESSRCRVVLQAGETAPVGSSRGRVSWNVE